MYKAIYDIDDTCIDEATQRIFTPFVRCYHLHSAFISVNGVTYLEGNAFHFTGHETQWHTVDRFALTRDDEITLDLNYFYIRPEDTTILDFRVDQTYAQRNVTTTIISKHYTEGQFSLDNGLYKNAVLNFGTVVEGLVNKQLGSAPLAHYINNCGAAQPVIDAMNYIREMRNRVHPNQIALGQDVSREEAIIARWYLEAVLRNL